MDEWVELTTSEGEKIDLIALTQKVLRARGIDTKRDGDDLEMPALGLVLGPRGLHYGKKAQSFQTTTIVHVWHPDVFPNPIFEYQHGNGATLVGSLESALDLWAQLDVPALADAARVEPQHCAEMRMEFPALDGKPARARRVILGPPARYGAPAAAEGAEEHCFCPCCLTTNNFDAFKPLVEREGSFAVRMYAARNEDGAALADCRINGEDYEAGMAALRRYVATWPGRGFELRKQYVIFQDAP